MMPFPDFRLSAGPVAGASRDAAMPEEASLCHCCGFPGALRPWQGSRILVCEVCTLAQDLTAPLIDSAVTLVWMPELSQSRIMTLSACAYQTVYFALTASGGRASDAWRSFVEALATDSDPGALPRSAMASARLLRAMMSRKHEAIRRLQSASPRHVGTALLMLDTSDPDSARSRDVLLEGLRILPLGCLYDGAEDVFPALLEARQDHFEQHSSRQVAP